MTVSIRFCRHFYFYFRCCCFFFYYSRWLFYDCVCATVCCVWFFLSFLNDKMGTTPTTAFVNNLFDSHSHNNCFEIYACCKADVSWDIYNINTYLSFFIFSDFLKYRMNSTKKKTRISFFKIIFTKITKKKNLFWLFFYQIYMTQWWWC